MPYEIGFTEQWGSRIASLFRNAFALEAALRKFTLSTALQPVVDVSPLLQEVRTKYAQGVNSFTVIDFNEVPDGELWEIISVSCSTALPLTLATWDTGETISLCPANSNGTPQYMPVPIPMNGHCRVTGDGGGVLGGGTVMYRKTRTVL